MKESYIAYEFSDNYSDFGYDSRYLDALASIFHIQSPVTATLEYKNKVYLSYSNDHSIVPFVKPTVNFIKQVIKNTYSTPDHFLAIYLIYNVDFSSLIKLAQRHFKNKKEKKECVESLDQLEKNINTATNDLDKALKKGNEYNVFDACNEEIVRLYKHILIYHQDDIAEYLERFIRPMQDSYKLHSYLENVGFNNVQDIIILPNPHTVHADVNVVSCFQNNVKLVDKPYVGVSKLCCGYCHAYLDYYEFLHRGTHGVCDDQWGIPWPSKEGKSPLEDGFKESIKSIDEFDIKNPPPQHRRLSIDVSEKEIFMESDRTLWDFKVQSCLINGKLPRGIKGYIFYEGKTTLCEYKYINYDYVEVEIAGHEGKIFSYNTGGFGD